MLRKSKRLQKTKDINYVFKYGKRNVAPHGVFFVYTKNYEKHSRITVIIGKKFSSLAVLRNKMKRIIRDSIKKFSDTDCKYDIVIGYTKKNKMLLYKEVEEDINFLISKINC